MMNESLGEEVHELTWDEFIILFYDDYFSAFARLEELGFVLETR